MKRNGGGGEQFFRPEGRKGEANKMRISITTDFEDDGGPIEPRLAMFADAGFSHIHWCEHWSRDFLYEDFYTEGVGRLLKRHGLKLLDTHGAQTQSASPLNPDETCRRRGVRLLENRIRFTASLGGDCVVIHPGSYSADDPAARKSQWNSLEKSVMEVARTCEDAGVRLAIENAAGKRPPEFDAFLKKFPPSLLGFCYDSGHANIAGEPEQVEIFGDRLIALHLHDNHGVKDEHALPGDGVVDWKRIAAALKACRYGKPVNWELSLRNSGLYNDVAQADFVREAFRRAARFVAEAGL